MASYMHHCCFLKQKIVFQTSEQGSDSGFSDTVYFTRHSLVEKKNGHDISLSNCRRKTVQGGRVSDGALCPERHRIT